MNVTKVVAAVLTFKVSKSHNSNPSVVKRYENDAQMFLAKRLLKVADNEA